MNDSKKMTDVPARIPDQVLAAALATLERVRAELAGVYLGPATVIDTLIVALLSRGHVLVEGVPGVAKTTLVRSFAEVLDASFRRIQFTPDLMPSDITGTVVLDMRTNAFELRKGPIFAHVILADEINRAPAKTQSAMLEAMAERQVTIEGTTLPLPSPFVVLATQNPIEQEGVYPLPEAQLDRFLVKLSMGYPDREDEVRMLEMHQGGRPPVKKLLTPTQVDELATLAEAVVVGSTIQAYIVALARWTRKHPSVLVGASPRASLALLRAARASALLHGRDYVNVDDVRALAGPVFAHRLCLTSRALVEGTSAAAVIEASNRTVPYDPA